LSQLRPLKFIFRWPVRLAPSIRARGIRAGGVDIAI
jgi:hypothetical protein